jgi:hypothetical protein
MSNKELESALEVTKRTKLKANLLLNEFERARRGHFTYKGTKVFVEQDFTNSWTYAAKYPPNICCWARRFIW